MEQKIAPSLPPVLGDSAALSQCLQNLITNALKYGEKGRWIAIHASCEESKDQKEVRIDVHDHGDGIDRGEMQRIFEPFYRSPAVVSKQIHGTGLGLPIAKSLAEAMGGRLSVMSEVGVGTVFTLRIPAFDDTNGTERKGLTRV
jgi:signal transduction histidine kinase